MTYTATPATITSTTSVRARNEVGQQTGNSLTLNFMAPSPVQNGERIYLKIPYEQFIVGSTGTVSCKARAGTLALSAVTCTLDTTSNTTYFIVHFPAPCSIVCSAGSVYTIELTGIKNAEWITVPLTRSIEIQTMTSDLLWIKDRRLTSIFTTPELVEGPITTRSITKANNVVN